MTGDPRSRSSSSRKGIRGIVNDVMRHGDRKFVTSLGGGFINKDQLWSKEKRELVARQRKQQLTTMKKGTADKSSTPQKEDQTKKM